MKERNMRFPQQPNPTKRHKNQPPKTHNMWLIMEAVMTETSTFNGVLKSAEGVGQEREYELSKIYFFY